MKVKPFLFAAFAALASCQTYEFSPVNPVAASVTILEVELMAKPLPPNIMLLLDKSDSMNKMVGEEGFNVDGSLNPGCIAPACAQGSTNCSPSCATRINVLRHVMEEFLDKSQKISDEDPRPLGKFGLTLFPADEFCEAPNSVRIEFAASDDEDALREKIRNISKTIFEDLYNSTALDRRPVVGGTPTGNALRFLRDHVSELGGDIGRRHFILLLTDGLPNCNDDVQKSNCEDSNECQCTMQTYGNISPGLCVNKETCGNRPDSAGCLDDYATVSVIEELRENGIETIVIGFDVDNIGDIGPENILNAMARAGGVSDSYFKADDRESLLKVLEELRGIVPYGVCVFRLDRAISDPLLLVVDVDGKRVPPEEGSYQYNKEENTIEFSGELCEHLKSSTPNNPVLLRVAVLRAIN